MRIFVNIKFCRQIQSNFHQISSVSFDCNANNNNNSSGISSSSFNGNACVVVAVATATASTGADFHVCNLMYEKVFFGACTMHIHTI